MIVQLLGIDTSGWMGVRSTDNVEECHASERAPKNFQIRVMKGESQGCGKFFCLLCVVVASLYIT